MIKLDDCVYHLNYPFNKDLLLKEYEDVEMTTFSSFNPNWNRSFDIGTHGNFLKQQFQKLVKGKVAAGYYCQKAGDDVKEHKDTGCKCRINVLLSDNDSTLYIANHEIKYQSALINVNEHSHYVDIAKKDRLIFSIIFLEDDYYTVKTIYK
jgi:hypothetical protein